MQVNSFYRFPIIPFLICVSFLGCQCHEIAQPSSSREDSETNEVWNEPYYRSEVKVEISDVKISSKFENELQNDKPIFREIDSTNADDTQLQERERANERILRQWIDEKVDSTNADDPLSKERARTAEKLRQSLDEKERQRNSGS